VPRSRAAKEQLAIFLLAQQYESAGERDVQDRLFFARFEDARTLAVLAWTAEIGEYPEDVR
jgi:hypothetical protein